MCGSIEESAEKSGINEHVDLWLDENNPVALIVRAGGSGGGISVEAYAYGADEDQGKLVRKSVTADEDSPLFDLFARFSLGVMLTVVADAFSETIDA